MTWREAKRYVLCVERSLSTFGEEGGGGVGVASATHALGRVMLHLSCSRDTGSSSARAGKSNGKRGSGMDLTFDIHPSSFQKSFRTRATQKYSQKSLC